MTYRDDKPLVAAALAKSLAPFVHVVVLSDGDKIATPSDLAAYEAGTEDAQREMREHGDESNDPGEVMGVWEPAGSNEEVVQTVEKAMRDGVIDGNKIEVEVRNVYFEWVPERYIDLYIAEEGPMGKEEIRERSLKIGRLGEKIFGGLYD